MNKYAGLHFWIELEDGTVIDPALDILWKDRASDYLERGLNKNVFVQSSTLPIHCERIDLDDENDIETAEQSEKTWTYWEKDPALFWKTFSDLEIDKTDSSFPWIKLYRLIDTSIGELKKHE